MNKSYRIVWNHVRNCLMVVSEATKSHSKAGGATTAVVGAVAAAVMTLGSAQTAEAATNWVVGATNPVGGYVYGNTLSFGSGDTLIVENTGSVSNTASGTYSVSITGITAGSIAGTSWTIENSGTIVGNYGAILVNQATLNGGITSSGLIQSTDTSSVTGRNAIGIVGSVVTGSLVNNGNVIAGSGTVGTDVSILGAGDGIFVSRASITGSINNTGTVVSQQHTGIEVYRSIITNDISNSGSVAAAHVGIEVFGVGTTLAGNLVNTGIVTASGGGIAFGSYATMGGSIINTGTVSAPGGGVAVWRYGRVNGNISNTGSIFAGYGIALQTQSTVAGSIINSGRIAGTHDGVFVATHSVLSGALINTGTITSVYNGILISLSTVGGGITNSGLIAGTSAAGVALNNSTVTGNIANNSGGTISGLAGINISTGSQLRGSITNAGYITSINNAGLITSSGAAINLTAGSLIAVGITNSGSIVGGLAGISASGGTRINGSISNSGLIQSTDTSTVAGRGAVVIYNATVAGGMVNSGSLIAGNGSIGQDDSVRGAGDALFVTHSSLAGSIINIGTVVSQRHTGIEIFGSTIAGDISNSGSVAAAHVGIEVFGAGTSLSGNLVNTGSIVVGSVGGIGFGSHATMSGSIINTGVVTELTCSGGAAGACYGLEVWGVASVGGSISNSGSVAAGYAIAVMSNSRVAGNIVNSGNIAATYDGIYVGTGIFSSLGGTISGGIINTGTIVSQAKGIVVSRTTVAGGITNSGLVSAVTIGINLKSNSTLSGGIANLAGGSITGAAGINVSNNSEIIGSINNAGYLSSINNAGLVTASGVAINVTVGGLIAAGITNTGTINAGTSSAAISVDVAKLNGGISNSAVIHGQLGIMVYQSTVSGGISNLAGASIVGTNYGIDLFSVSTLVGGITNAGLIAGGINSVFISNNSTLDRLVITGNNTASFSGAVRAPNAPVTVAGGATYTLNSNFQVSNFDNQGTLIAPVASVATPTITGNLTLGSSGTFSPMVASQSSYSQITVSGNVSLAGVMAIDAQAMVLTPGSTLTGVITASSVTGTFASVTDNSVLYNFYAVYGGTTLGLTMLNSSVCHGTLATNQIGPCEVGYDAPQLITAGYSITGGAQGIQVLEGYITSTGSGVGITNTGLVSGLNTGIQLQAGSALQGAINNSGSIGGGSFGIVASYATLGGGLVNSGTISGSQQDAIYLKTSSLGSGITNSGLISGANAGLYVRNSNLSGGINNSGTMVGSIGGIFASASALSGGLTNSGRIVGSSYGIALSHSTLSGGIINAAAGTIAGPVGINISTGSELVGGISNAGYLSSINNAGLITASGYGMNLAAGSLIATGITNTGTISSYVAVFFTHASLSGGIANSGSLVGGAQGIYVGYSTLSGGITNSGQIAGGAYGILSSYSRLSGGISNSGLISGATTYGVEIASSLGDGIANSGTIMGGNSGIEIVHSTLSGGVANSGLIQGGSLSGAGILLRGNTGTITSVLGGLNNSGSIVGQIGVELTYASLSGGLTNSGLISGSTNAIYVASNSSLDNIVITGNDTASFSGTVNAPNTPVTVVGSATYTLNSNFTVNNFDNEGFVIVPVASVATPTITGNFTQGSNATLEVAVNSQTSTSHLAVTGTASLAGTLTVNVTNGITLIKNSTLAGIITAGSVTGSFSNVADNSFLYAFVPVYSTGAVGLSVVQNGYNSLLSAAQQMGNVAAFGAAGTLDIVADQGGMNQAIAAFGAMSTAQQVSNALSQTLPTLSSNTPIQSLAVLSAINQAIESRSLNQRGLSSGDTFYGDSSVWMKPFGSWMNQGNSNGAYGFKANSGGLMIGADHQIDTDTKLGAAFAWGNSSATSNAGNTASQSQTSNLYQFIGYGNYAFTDAINLNAQANGGWNNNSSNRQIAFMGTSAQASYSSAVWHAGLGLDSPQHLTESTTVIPQIRYDYTWIRNNGYNETGATNGLGLNVNAQTYQTSIASLDGKLIQKLDDHNSVNANLGVGYNFSPTQTSVAASFQGAPTLQFTTTGVNPGAVMGHAGVGYVYKVKENVDVGIRYDIDFQSSYTNQIATAKARWSF